MFVEPEFDTLDEGLLAGEQTRVVIDIPRGHVPRGHIEIGEAENLLLPLQAMVLEEAPTDEHKSAGFVFAVKANAREVIEESVEMAALMHLAQPRRPLGGQSPRR